MLLTEIPEDINYQDYLQSHTDKWKIFGYIPYKININQNAISYYTFPTKEDINKRYFVLIKMNERFAEDEKLEINEYIQIVQKSFRKAGDIISKEEILDLTFNDKNLDIDNFVTNNPYILWFLGCDDGHFFMRFKNDKEREEYIKYFSSINKYEEFKEIFYPEDNLYKQFVFQSN